MPPTTRKQAQANDSLETPNVTTAGPPEVAMKVEDRKCKVVNTFEDVFGPVLGIPSDDHDSDHSDYAGGKKRKRKSGKDLQGKPKKRMTTFRPPPAPVVPDLSDDEDAGKGDEFEEEKDDGLWSAERRHNAKGNKGSGKGKKNGLPQILSLQIAAGNAGAKTVINLDLADLLKKAGVANLTLPDALAGETASFNMKISENTTLVENNATGFLDLPYELRLNIYGQVFKFEGPVEFENREFSRSAHFLRTCKTVLEEGRVILYGENSFHFTRDPSIRGKFYESVWKEIGYKDIRKFLETIGPVNVGCLKHLSFQLTDGPDNRTRVVPGQIPERKFVNDPHLHKAFRIIGANTTLKTLALQFSGRAMVNESDYHFLKSLTEIKCHKLVTINRLGSHVNKCAYGIKEKMKEIMCVRDENGERVKPDACKKLVRMVYDNSRVWALIAE